MVSVRERRTTLSLGLSAWALVACASVPPPQELVDARKAIEKSAAGPAAKLAPAQLDTGCGAVRDHCDRQACGVRRVVHDLDVEHGGESAQALGADPERIDLVHQFKTQFFHACERSAAGRLGLQFMDVDM
jgi:hypothetical protein